MSADWKKMKVQALRDQLASRGLDTTGVKAALVERLENLSSTEGDAQLDGTKKNVAAEALEDGEHESVKFSAKAADSRPLAMKLPTVDKTADERVESGKPNDSVAASPAAITDLEKKRRRAERFGTDLKISEAEKRKLRAARFNEGVKNGAAVNESDKVGAMKVADSALSDAESAKRKARAERFGSIPQEVTGQHKVIGQPKLSQDEEAKKKARMARFAMAAK